LFPPKIDESCSAVIMEVFNLKFGLSANTEESCGTVIARVIIINETNEAK
jgi:hypothetical protein